jgi:hypothetical protein
LSLDQPRLAETFEWWRKLEDEAAVATGQLYVVGGRLLVERFSGSEREPVEAEMEAEDNASCDSGGGGTTGRAPPSKPKPVAAFASRARASRG